MKKTLSRLGLATALAATTLTLVAAPAQARDRWRDGGDDTAVIAIGAGILGLALGAAIADRDDRRYYDRGYYPNRRYVTVRDRPGYYYYYDGQPNRYYRDRYYDRYYGSYWRERRGGRDGWRDRDWRRDRNWQGNRNWHGDRNWRNDRDWRGDRDWRNDRDWRRDRDGRDRYGRDWRR